MTDDFKATWMSFLLSGESVGGNILP